MTERDLSSTTFEPLGTRSTGALPDVHVDEAREMLRQAQMALVALGYSVGSQGDSAANIDGVWGASTREAVLAFQDDRNLARTGQLDLATTEALLDVETSAPQPDDFGIESLDATEDAEQLLHSTDRETLNDVLDDMRPTDAEADEDLLPQ